MYPSLVVRSLLEGMATLDNRIKLVYFMVQLVELMSEFLSVHSYSINDVSLCNVGLRSLQDDTVLLIDLDRCQENSEAKTTMKSLKRMYTLPGEVAQIALDCRACDESWRIYIQFELKDFFVKNVFDMEITAKMFEPFCKKLFNVAEVPKARI